MKGHTVIVIVVVMMTTTKMITIQYRSFPVFYSLVRFSEHGVSKGPSNYLIGPTAWTQMGQGWGYD